MTKSNKPPELKQNLSTSQLDNNSKEIKMQRTTFLVDPVIYKEIKRYALEHDVTVTSLINQAMKQIVSNK